MYRLQRLRCFSIGALTAFSLDRPQGFGRVDAQKKVLQCSEADGKGRDDFIVKAVIVTHRHGARTPTDQLPGQPEPKQAEYEAMWGKCPVAPKLENYAWKFNGSSEVEACKHGSLTAFGSQQLVGLGTYLRERYNPEPFSNGSGLTVRSTISPRAVLSAVSLLQGLYPAMTRDEAASLIETRHLTARYGLDETMFGTAVIWAHPEAWSKNDTRVCPRLGEIVFEAIAKTYPERERALPIATMIKQRANLGSEIESVKFSNGLADHLSCASAQGASFPYGCTKEEHEILDAALHHCFVAAADRFSTEGALLSGGRLVADVDALVEAATSKTGSKNVSLHILSGHDVSLTSLLVALGFPNEDPPSFGASIQIELLQNMITQQWQVRLVYFDSVPYSVDKHGKELLWIPLEAWKVLVEPALDVAQNWQVKCKAASSV